MVYKLIINLFLFFLFFIYFLIRYFEGKSYLSPESEEQELPHQFKKKKGKSSANEVIIWLVYFITDMPQNGLN